MTHLAPLVRAARSAPRNIGGGVILARLHGTLYDGRREAEVYELSMDTRHPAVHCTLCLTAGAHGAYWRDALDHYARNPVQTAAAGLVEPSVPWLAVEMLPGAIEYTPDELMMLADAERCVAWVIAEEAP